MCADAAESWRDATETVALHAGRAVVAEAFRMVLDRLGEMERAAFKLRGSPTLTDQYGALIAGFEDVLAEMGDSVNTE